MVKSLFHLYSRSSHHLYFIFLSRVKINSINWPAPNIWVFIAQLVEHCSANAEAMGSNPVEALKFFFFWGLNLQLLKLRLPLRWSNLYFMGSYVGKVLTSLAFHSEMTGFEMIPDTLVVNLFPAVYVTLDPAIFSYSFRRCRIFIVYFSLQAI